MLNGVIPKAARDHPKKNGEMCKQVQNIEFASRPRHPDDLH